MRVVRWKCAALSALVWAWSAGAMPLGAQTSGRDSVSASRRGTWEAWVGIGGPSPQWGVLGETPDMRLALLALRWTRPIGARPAADELPALEWSVDLVPLAVLSPPLVSLRGSGVPCESGVLCVLPAAEAVKGRLFVRNSPLGFGVTPIGLTRRFHRAGRVSSWIGVNGGALYFSERVPTTQASRFNFTATGELGLRFGSPVEPGITLAYRFHHISNGGTAGENPGVASHLVTVGVHRPRRM